MLQGHDPLIMENNKEKEADTVSKVVHSTPISQLTLTQRETQLFQAQVLQKKKEEEE